MSYALLLYRVMDWREAAMKKIEKILVPTDLSGASLPALGYALSLGKTLGAEVTVLYVLSHEDFLRYGERLREEIVHDPAFRVPDPFLKEYELALQRFLTSHFADLISSVRVREQMEVGDFDKEIVSEAKKQKTDLIVLSARERTGLARFLRRSVIEKVNQSAPCPVLSIRPNQNENKLRAA
jgi:nucleotide-binding universal stress UspA family protein